MGLREPGCARRPAHGRQRRRQYRRAADGGGRAPLRRHPRTAADWLDRVEIEHDRLDDRPTTYSGGMRQRLQIARNLVTEPRLVFMDEPTGGLDVSVQARLLDLLRGLVATLNLSAVLVTHDLGGRAAAHAPADGDAGRPRGRGRPHRPGAGRSAARLHPDARRLDPAGVTPWIPCPPRLRPHQILRRACPGRPRAAGAARRGARRLARRVPGAGRSLGRRQEHAAALALRQLPRRRGLDPRPPRRPLGRAGARRAPDRARRAPPHHGLRQPVPARDPARRHHRRRGRARHPPRHGR